MKTSYFSTAAALILFNSALLCGAAPFNSGSTGADGDLIVTAAVTVPLPPDGVLNYRKVNIGPSGVLTFVRNSRNTPVTLLAVEEVLIEGAINLDGEGGTATSPGRGAPGGFDGGRPAEAGMPPGAGHGPGGGDVGSLNTGGSASYGTSGTVGNTEVANTIGAIYGDPLLLPIVGGSGGAGLPSGSAGAGGGGAILIASSVKISLTGGVYARGGENGGGYNDGSGGAIRLVAPVIDGNGTIDTSAHEAGYGRARIDSPDARGASFTVRAVVSYGSLMLTKLPIEPKLTILKVAGRDIDPAEANFLVVTLPSGSPATQSIIVQARDFGDHVPIAVVLTPERGARQIIQAEIDNLAANPGSITVNATFPVNVPVVVNAWTR